MRTLSVQEFEQDTDTYIAEAESGQRLVLMRGDRPVAEIGPAASNDSDRSNKSEEDRLAALAEFKEMLDRGMDLGGFRIEHRDTLHDPDSAAAKRREAAIQRLDEIMDEGIPLGGTPPSRDEMHDGR
jgi:antitoxin (DNA-binding transcriptional repressor) of toxin-antitoxin stability system